LISVGIIKISIFLFRGHTTAITILYL